MLESLEELFQQFRNLGEFSRDLITWITAFGCIVLLFINLKYFVSLFRATKLYLIDQIPSACCRIDLRNKYGQWAVVSGATDGIGLALAHELARRGMSIIIIGRNEEKLAKAKASLENDANVGEIVAIKKDFSDSSLDSYAEMSKQINAVNRDIGILINNVGLFYPKFYGFHNEEEQNLKATVDVNILSTVMLSRAIIPSMIERRRGLVVNVSSILGSVTFPFFGIYASTKTFVNSFSKQLQYEYRGYPNMKIVNLTTGPVDTKPFEEIGALSEERRSSHVFVKPDEYARRVMNILTKSCHPLEFSGLAIHGFMKRTQDFLDGYGLFCPIVERLYFKK